MADQFPDVIDGHTIPPELQAQMLTTFGAAQEYLHAQLSPASLRAYKEALGHFGIWCGPRGFSVLPALPETVVMYVAELAQEGKKVATLTKILSAIRFAHRQKKLTSPTDHPLVTGVMAGIRRIHGSAPIGQKTPLLNSDVKRMVLACPKSLTGARDKAVLALGFAGAFRRSELAALDVSDLAFHRDGNLICRLRRSKTDQGGKGAFKPIFNGDNLQPVYFLRTWLETAGITEGPVFRRMDWAGGATEHRLSSKWIASIVQRYAKAVGIDPKMVGAHSLRSGFVTTATEHNVPIYRIMEVTLQVNAETVLRYMRRANQFRDHAGSEFL